MDGARSGRSKSGASTSRTRPPRSRTNDERLASDLLPALGGKKLNDVRRADVLRLVERVQRRGAGGSLTGGVLMPLRSTRT
jgi:hypothetical protein